LWDEKSQKLLIARDRLGKKPMHYALHRGRLYFASEIKSILAVAPELAEVHRAALLQYMYLGYIPDPATAFKGIHKLPPGHLLEFERGEVRIRKYWDLPQYATDHHELILEPDIVGTIEKLTRSLEEPFADSSMLPTYFISCLARQHVTVALSGDGGDELFAGYERYGIQQKRERFAAIPPALSRLYRRHLFPLMPKGMRGRQLSYN